MRKAWISFQEALAWCLRRPWAMLFILLCVVLLMLKVAVHHKEQPKPKTPVVAAVPQKPAPKPPAPVVKIEQKNSLHKGSWVFALDTLEAENLPVRKAKKHASKAEKAKVQAERQKAQVAAIVAKAKKYGIRCIIIRTSVHGKHFSRCPRELAKSLHKACQKEGISVWGYGRISARSVADEVECAKEVLRPVSSGGMDLDGYIYDAEGDKGETQGQDKNVEAILSDVHSWLKATVPNKRLAYSTYGIMSFHDWFPRELYNKYCHYAMPQLYWVSWRSGKLRWSLEESLARSKAEWVGNPIPVIPTVQSYSEVDPDEMTKFLSGWDTSLGFNTFRWELTGAKQLQAINSFKCGSPDYRLSASAQVKTPVKTEKSVNTEAEKASPPAMPLPPTGKGDMNGDVVIVDPGHGGRDPGCSWPLRLEKKKVKGKMKEIWHGPVFLESSLTYMMAWELATNLRKRGATVYLTAFDPVMYFTPKRALDELPKPSGAKFYSDGSKVTARTAALKSRVATATSVQKTFEVERKKRGWKRLMWVSVHIDSTSGKLEGAHVLRKLSGSNVLADSIGLALKEGKVAWRHTEVPVVFTSTRNSKHHKGRKQSVYVLDCNLLTLVGLVETGFPRASGRDSWLLREASHRTKIVNAIANGLAKASKRLDAAP